MDLFKIREELSFGKSLADIKLRVTNYARVSTDHELQMHSLYNQVEYFDEIIKSNPNWTYVSGYVDEGISGTTDIKRDNFMQMIEDAKKGLFDLIITKEISRFSRNTLDSIKYTRELLSYGVAVLFLNDNINTVFSDAELRLTIMASMAQDEVRRLSERVKFGMQRSIKKGNILGNDLLYGYKKDKKTGNLVVCDEEAIVVKRLFSMYVIDGISLTIIAKKFNEEKIKTALQKSWKVTTLARMIRNPKYKGYYCAHKSETINYIDKKVKVFLPDEWVMYKDYEKVPLIIDENIWNRANERLNSYQKSTDKSVYCNRYLLSGKIICNFDKQTFQRHKIGKNNPNIAWSCANYLKNGRKSCAMPSLREEEIYWILLDILKKWEIDLNHVKKYLVDIYQKNSNKISYNKGKVRKDKILKKKRRALELNLEGLIENSEFARINMQCDDALRKLDEDEEILAVRDYEVFLGNYWNDLNIEEMALGLILKNIYVKNFSVDYVELDIYMNIEMEQILNASYEFKRGYDRVGTRRYTFYYKVNTYSSF